MAYVTMVKKRLASGEPCRKCVDAENLLERRGLSQFVNKVVWADESQGDSEGIRLAKLYGVDAAPFFIVKDSTESDHGGGEVVYTSVLKLIREQFAKPEIDPPLSAEQSLGVAMTELPSGLESRALSGGPLKGGDGDAPRRFGRLNSEQIEALNRSLANASPAAVIERALGAYGAQCAIAFSGAEDVVLIDMAKKAGLPFSVFCLDTGRLHPETYRFVERVRAHYDVAVRWVFPHFVEVERLVRTKGAFSFYQDGHGECCGVRKVAPLRRLLADFSAWMSGQRKDQSPTRADIAVVHEDRLHDDSVHQPTAEDPATIGEGPTLRPAAARKVATPSISLVKFNPLANWSLDQVWQYIRDHDVPFNELHTRGFISVGCEPCTRAVNPGEHERAGRWWWEEATRRECGLHVKPPAGS